MMANLLLPFDKNFGTEELSVSQKMVIGPQEERREPRSSI
jgi:hypothetical protein